MTSFSLAKRPLLAAMLLLTIACGGDSGTPTAPTGGGTPAPSGPTALVVELNIGPVQTANRVSLLEGQPPVQHLALSASGSVSAQNGSVNNLSATVEITTGSLDAEVQDFLQSVESDLQASLDSVSPDWELISPRINLTYDITGDGKNVVKLSAARYMATARLTVSGTTEDGDTVSASDTASFDSNDFTPVTSTCVPNRLTLCALDRFHVDLNWRRANGKTGRGKVAPDYRYDDGGLFYFFNPEALDVFVQVSNYCVMTDHFQVSVEGNNTDVEFTITVT